MYSHFGLLSVHNMYTHFGLLSVTQQHVHTLWPAVCNTTTCTHTLSCCQSLTHYVLLSKPHTLCPAVKASHTIFSSCQSLTHSFSFLILQHPPPLSTPNATDPYPLWSPWL